jgi:DNA-binding XRE family transcriptional regulator
LTPFLKKWLTVKNNFLLSKRGNLMTLREVRFYKGLNQWDLAIKTGICQSKLSLIERGYVNPKKDEKKLIAKVLGCKVSEVFPENEGA